MKFDVNNVRRDVIGLEKQVPLIDGTSVPYINFDNAASTPVLRPVYETVNEFLEWYSSVHRGAGYKSRVATEAYEQARDIVCQFVGANQNDHVVLFTKHTTEAINKISRRLTLDPNDVILTTFMEHHSNDLPWRLRAKVIHVAVDEEGFLDEEDFDRCLEHYAQRIRLVAISGASNVTGVVNSIHRLAEKAHQVGAMILVDAAQLAPHRKIDMLPLADPRHLDFVALSSHKMYAPYGSGALVARRDVFEQGTPAEVGGGTVAAVTQDDVEWAHLPDRDEAGSPNVVGAIAFAASAQTLEEWGMKALAEHERQLTSYALEGLKAIPGVEAYGPESSSQRDRVGVVSFNVDGILHSKVATILNWEGGIGVRNGCFCAHPYIIELLGLSSDTWQQHRIALRDGDKRNIPGLVRASFGCYNNLQEVATFTDLVRRVAEGEYRGEYIQDVTTGDYEPRDVKVDYRRSFSLSSRQDV